MIDERRDTLTGKYLSSSTCKYLQVKLSLSTTLVGLLVFASRFINPSRIR